MLLRGNQTIIGQFTVLFCARFLKGGELCLIQITNKSTTNPLRKYYQHINDIRYNLIRKLMLD